MEALKDVVLQEGFEVVWIGRIDTRVGAEKGCESIICRSQNYLLSLKRTSSTLMRHTCEVPEV